MFTNCPAVALASSHADNACAVAAPGSALRGPAPDVTPSGTPHCKNVCSNVHGEWRKARSNQAEHTAGPKNLPAPTPCAGPRAATPRQLTPLAVHATALDSVWTAHAVFVCRSRSRDTAGSTTNTASGELRGDTVHCNSAIVDAGTRTAVHTP